MKKWICKKYFLKTDEYQDATIYGSSKKLLPWFYNNIDF